MEKPSEIKDFINIIKNRFCLITVITTVIVLISSIVSFSLIDPIYEAKSTLIVNNKYKNGEVKDITNENVMGNQKLALTYSEVAKSRKVLGQAINDLELNVSYEELLSKISISPIKNTQVIDIEVKNKNAKLAYKVANKISNLTVKEIREITKINNIEVIDYAVIPAEPINQNPLLIIPAATISGIIIGMATVFLLDYLNIRKNGQE